MDYAHFEETGEWEWDAWTLPGIKFPTLATGDEISEAMALGYAAAQEAVDNYMMSNGILCDCCIAEGREDLAEPPKTLEQVVEAERAIWDKFFS